MKQIHLISVIAASAFALTPVITRAHEGEEHGSKGEEKTVKGEVIATNPAPDPTAIPWLLLKAIGSKGTGLMTRVDSIRRTDTHGGLAPTTGCDAEHLDTIARIPYTASYTFYSTRP